MPQEDEDLSRFLTKAYGCLGITVLDSCRSKEMVVKDGRVHTLLSNGQTVVSDVAVLAVGRIPNSEGLDLAAAGVDVDKYGYIAIDEVMRTNISHIYAVGDIGYRNVPIDMSLVHVAEAEGRCAALSILGRNPTLSMQHVPFIIFTLPMIAGAGMNERMARDEYGDSIRVGKYPYGRNHRAHAMHTPVGFVKLIVAPEGNDRVLGVRAIGRDSDSIVGTVSLMIDNDLPYSYLLDSIQPHPSLSESLQGAAHIIHGNLLGYQPGEEDDFLPS
jgi:dihydrolipoamide dehydrogenase